ncbi:hypothetical protein FQN54_008882 [Arachnomyces sp. PD_36]|nr:hypothetical protein FQN54_008882 [Arachnomyces sp. PD_36]
MATSSSAETQPPRAAPVNPVLRNALRLSLSASEYRKLHQYVMKRSPASLKAKIQDSTPTPDRYGAIVRSSRRADEAGGGSDKYNETAIRASLRVFLATASSLKLFDILKARLAKGSAPPTKTKTPLHRSPTFRLSLSLSLILLLHRLLHRFFTRLRATLLTSSAAPFRERNPRISHALTSKYAPSIGSSAAGFALGIYPDSGLHASAAIYLGSRAGEFLWNVAEGKGGLLADWKRPWWVGSWLFMPVSFGQLFYAFVFEREVVPGWFGQLLFKLTPAYIQQRPAGFPAEKHWPDGYEIVDSLAGISAMKWPPFTSPILHPNNPSPLPSSLKSISPITSPAHAALSSLSCALLHPSTPSCTTAYLHHNLLSVAQLARPVTFVYLAMSLLSYKRFLSAPFTTTNALFRKIITMTLVLSTSVGSAWGSICLFNSLLSRSVLPTKRFFLSGAAAGLPFAVFARGTGNRAHFLSIFRIALNSAWKIGPKKGMWRRWKGIEVSAFVLAWALAGCVLEGNPGAVDDLKMRKALAWLRGDGFVDLVEKRKGKKVVKGDEEKGDKGE